MSEHYEGQDERQTDPRSIAQKLPVTVMEHMTKPDPTNDAAKRMQTRWGEFDQPIFIYGYHPTEKAAIDTLAEMEEASRWKIGSGKRRINPARIAERKTVMLKKKAELYSSIGGFSRKQVGASTINQNVTETVTRPQGKGIFSRFRRNSD